MAKRKQQSDWLTALERQGLTVRTTRDALAVQDWLDTGNYALNWCISGRLLRGYPLGHTVEIFGDPSTGKSFLVARALAMAQARAGVALLDDTEGAYNLDHTARLGVDIDKLAYRNSHTVKEHLATAKAFVDAYTNLGLTTPAVLALDSLAQLSTEHELDTMLDKRDMSKAAEVKAFFRIIAPQLYGKPLLHISANHTIAAIGSMFQTRTTPGGGGAKFQSTVRLDMRMTTKIKSATGYTGVICRVFVDKNRIAPPWKETRLAIPFDEPISRASGLIPLLVDLQVLNVVGTSLTFKDAKLGPTYKSKDKFLEQDELAEQLLDQYPELLEEVDAMLAERGTQRLPLVEEDVEE